MPNTQTNKGVQHRYQSIKGAGPPACPRFYQISNHMPPPRRTNRNTAQRPDYSTVNTHHLHEGGSPLRPELVLVLLVLVLVLLLLLLDLGLGAHVLVLADALHPGLVGGGDARWGSPCSP